MSSLDSARDAHPTVRGAQPEIPDYELLQSIGRGAYGEVWLAQSLATGALRAVKIVQRATFTDDRPFEREFEGICRFEAVSRSHPSQLALFHVGRSEGYFFYVMELADAAEPRSDGVMETWSNGQPPSAQHSNTPTLQYSASYTPHTLRHDLPVHGRLPAARVLEIGLALTEALTRLHGQGLVHRDIKPSNIIFVEGRPKLADIGLVTDASDQCSIVGTEGYLAPEGPGTPQADLFALGKVLYEIATGLDRRRYPEIPAEIRAWPDRKLVFELNEIVLKACAADARERYPNAEAMLADLQHVSEGRSVKRRRTWQEARRLVPRLAAAAAVIIAAWLLFSRFNDSTIQRSNAATPASIFVLPFRNDGTNQVDELLRSRITDAIIDGLALVEGVKVGPRRSGFLFQDENVIRRRVGKQFGVEHIISGTTDSSGDQIRLKLKLHRANDDQQVWSAILGGSMASLVDTEVEAVKKLAAALAIELSPDQRPRILRKLANNWKACELYRSALTFGLNSRDGYLQTVELLNQAIVLDPNYAQAHAFLAQANQQADEWHLSPKQAMSEAKKEAMRALDIDETLPNAHIILGVVLAMHERDYTSAHEEYKRAIELNPESPVGHWAYSIFLRAMGRRETAHQELMLARRLDQDSLITRRLTVQQYWSEHQFEKALEECLEAVKLSPNDDTRWMLGPIYTQLRRFDEAIAELRLWRSGGDAPDEMAYQAYAYAASGKHQEALKLLDELMNLSKKGAYVSPYLVALVHIGLGNTDRAFAYLHQAVEERSHALVGIGIHGLKTDPYFDSLRSDPRCDALLRQIGLNEPKF